MKNFMRSVRMPANIAPRSPEPIAFRYVPNGVYLNARKPISTMTTVQVSLSSMLS